MLLMMTLLLSGCVSEKNESQKMTTAERIETIINKANKAPVDVLKKKFDDHQEKEDSRIVYELPPKTKFVSDS